MSDFVIVCSVLAGISASALVATPFVSKKMKKKIRKKLQKEYHTKEQYELKWTLAPDKKQSIRT